MTSFPKRRAFPGDSLAEYGFIAALVLVALIGIVTLLGNNLNSVLGGLKGDMIAQTEKTKLALANQAKAREEWERQQRAALEGGGGGADVSSLMKGNQVCAGNFCVKPPATVTAGSNGGQQFSQQAANVLSQISKWLEENPDADPELVRKITQLANTGHGIANSQKQIISCRDGTTCGGSLTSGVTGLRDGRAAFENLAKDVRAHLEQNPGSLPPAMQNVVNFESEQILGISHGFELSGSSTWQYNGNTATIHNKSNRICRNGGAPPSCVQ